MKISRLLILSLIIASGACHLVNPYTGVVKKIEKGQYDPASFRLSRIKIDSSTRAYGAYVRARHFLAHGSPFYQIDSAAYWAHYGDSLWSFSRQWEQNRVIKLSKRSVPFQSMIPEIDSLAFSEALEENSEKDYQHYIEYYPSSKFIDRAVQLRDSLAFEKARKENTYIAYKKFLDAYPNSHQAEDAKEIYELLLYETHTRDRNKASYENFISKFPHSPYLNEAEEQLFLIYTLDHRKESYEAYLSKYPESAKADEANLWIRHLQMNYDSVGPVFFLPRKESTELQMHRATESTNLVVDSVKDHLPCEPFFEPYILYRTNGKWGMADARGQGIIPAVFHNLEKLNHEIYAYRNEKKFGLIHVSGFMISDALYDDIRVLNDTFLWARRNSGRYLLAYNGSELTELPYDEIRFLGNDNLAFKKSGIWSIARGNEFLKWPPAVELEWLYDSISVSEDGTIQIIGSDSIRFFDKSLNEIDRYAFDSFRACPQGFQILQKGTYLLIAANGKQLAESSYPISTFDEGFIKRMDSTYQCFLYKDTIAGVDSFEYFRPYYFRIYKDSSVWLLNASGIFDISPFERLSLSFYKIGEADTFCFVISQKNKQGLISAAGDTIIEAAYDEVRVFDSLNIRVKNKGKFGLLDFKGETILRPEFDAISNYDNGGFTLFHNRRFGYIHEAKDIYLKAYQNESLKLVKMRRPFFSRQSDEGMELLDLKAKKELEVVKDIMVINDSLVFFNLDFQWHLKKQTEDGAFEDLGVSCTGYELWYDDEDVPHVIFYKPTGEGFYDTELESKIYPEYYSIRPKRGLDGKLQYFIAIKYYEEINLYLLKLLDREGNELHKVLTSEEAMAKMGCSID